MKEQQAILVVSAEQDAADLADLGEELGVFSRRYYEWLTERLKVHAVNPGRRKIMRLLRDNGPLKMSQLAAELNLDPKRMTKMVDLLEAEHFVRRVTEPEDRRTKVVELTDKGRAAWQPMNDAFIEAIGSLVEDMTADELSRLHEIVARLTPRLALDRMPQSSNKISDDF